MAQLLLGPLLRVVAGDERVGHLIERGSKATNFRRVIFEVCASIIIAVAPFSRDIQQIVDGAADENAASVPGGVGRREETGENKSDAAPNGAVDRTERFGLSLAGAEKEILGGQSRRHISEYSS